MSAVPNIIIESSGPKPPPAELWPTRHLTLRYVWALTIHHWRENPIVRRLWKRVVWRAILCGFAAYALELLFYRLIRPATGVAPFISSFLIYRIRTFIPAIVVICYTVFIARWSYRETFTRNADARIAPFTFTDRLMGILLPSVAAYLLFSLVWASIKGVMRIVYGTLNNPVGTGYLWMMRTEIAGLPAIFCITLLLAPMVLRATIAHASGGKNIWFVAQPFIVAFSLCYVCGKTFSPSFPYPGRILSALFFETNLVRDPALLVWLLPLLMVGSCFLFFAIMRGFLEQDIPRAHDNLFQAEG